MGLKGQKVLYLDSVESGYEGQLENGMRIVFTLEGKSLGVGTGKSFKQAYKAVGELGNMADGIDELLRLLEMEML